jgi:hypothetical protein
VSSGRLAGGAAVFISARRSVYLYSSTAGAADPPAELVERRHANRAYPFATRQCGDRILKLEGERLLGLGADDPGFSGHLLTQAAAPVNSA